MAASDIDGHRDWIQNERDGLLFEMGDGEALGKAVARLLSDREWARGLGARAREIVVEQGDFDKNFEATLRILETACAQGSTRRK